MHIHELSQAEYDATWHAATMIEKTHSAVVVVDIWPYALAAMEQMYPREATDQLNVNHVYECRDGAFQHILIGTNHSNIYLVVVVDVQGRCIEGHFRLDIGKLYGLSPADA